MKSENFGSLRIDGLKCLVQFIFIPICNLLGSPNPKKWLSFGFVGIFEYIILPMLIIFLGMCPNSYGWMPSL